MIPSPLKPTSNFLGIPEDGVNVGFTSPRQAKPHHTRTCSSLVLKKVKMINQLGCQYRSVSAKRNRKRCMVMNVTDHKPTRAECN